ncbi:hypothetical protein Golob_007187 [Gossypium lobatum]|uniref:Uncharacterized protein n=1 Tax=Gossypium lobatum TaxID=34289 RepID=A0A7J8MC33_9ROSI|nr:hypothetical protein [Gossypium lobatum]
MHFSSAKKGICFSSMLLMAWGKCRRFWENFTQMKRLKIMFQLIGLSFQMRKD